MVEAINDGVVTEPEAVARYHRSIASEMRHLTSLIDDLFELARLEAVPEGAATLSRDVVALDDLISDTLAAMHEQANACGVQLSGGVEDNLPPVSVDARQLHRVLSNLVQNSLTHTRSGGHVAIRGACVSDPAGTDARHIIVRVVDDGDGIAAADLPHVFEPTFRAERSRRRDTTADHRNASFADSWATGAGLGLAIAQRLVEAHGGTIRAESPLSPALATFLAEFATPDALVGLGTCLTVSLPV
jgi:signal transduction histidine kinase